MMKSTYIFIFPGGKPNFCNISKSNELPRISIQKFNSYLKEIAELIGINKILFHHLARRFFATTVLLFNDMSMEIVSALLGHSAMSITQDSYAKIVNKKIPATMAVFYEGVKE